jgi:hypothetical protein
VASIDGSVENIENDCVKQRHSVGKVPVQGSDADSSPMGDRIPGRLAPDLKDQFSRGVEKSAAAPSSVSPHRSIN